MPQADYLYVGTGRDPSLSTVPPCSGPQLDLQSPASTLRQHLDPEALPRPDYFDSLDDLHLWHQMNYGDNLQDNLESCSQHNGPPVAGCDRPSSPTKATPKLVVCHDFQGGYNEDPQQRGYSLEHLHLVDTFIYFSHKRVSVPPVGWLTAAARSCTKVLGSLLFEWAESIPDMARLLRGPERKAMPLRGEPCFSPQYAIELIGLALERGFSGYLVNIEVGLDLGFSCSGEAWPAWVGEKARVVEMHRNAERLRGWVHYLREEGTRRFIEAGKDADEWEVMWYDSVVYPHGQLAWQDALNQHNISFFQAAHTFFTNYTWARPPQPLPPGHLVDLDDQNPQILQLRGFGLTGPDDGGFHPQLLLSAAMVDSLNRLREDVHVGIDVFGRNCWGGLEAWRSLDMIGPQKTSQEALGLSVALFAPGWTWEEKNAGRDLEPSLAAQTRQWSDWWHIDSAFWIGLPNNPVPNQYRITLTANDVKPLQSYFNRSSLTLRRRRRRAGKDGFHTNFSFGSGASWFDRGKCVHDWTQLKAPSKETESMAGFTDMGVCMPKPDLLYTSWHDAEKWPGKSRPELESVSWAFDQERVWSGTTSLLVSMATNKLAKTSSVRVNIPLCSAVISDGPQHAKGEGDKWQYTVVYDTSLMNAANLETSVVLADSCNEETQAHVSLGDVVHRDMGHGWKAVTVLIRLPHLGDRQGSDPLALSLGFSVAVESRPFAQIRIGALQLCKEIQSGSPANITSSIDVRPASNVYDSLAIKDQKKRLQASVLDWSAARDASSSVYYNVWVQQRNKPDTRVWLGTSTREATPFQLCLPDHLVIPPHLAEVEEDGLEFVVTSLDLLQPRIVARATATVL